MGKIKQGILGGFKGKVGTVIGASWNGIEAFRNLSETPRPQRKRRNVPFSGKSRISLAS